MRKTPFKPVLSFLLFLCLKILFIEMGVAQNTTFIPVNVGVALDLDSLDANIALSCINMALSDFYATHGGYKTRVALAIRDSKKDVVGAAAAGSFNDMWGQNI
ncbi:glutamate receptor [Salix suchowensis]|nr:glutamate receptor [Salix suchowensis]